MLPVIDIAGVRANDAQATREAAAAIHAACTGPGFFYVRNHGVPTPVIDTLLAEARDFFHLPPQEKRRAAINARHRGFNALGDALMYGATRPDLKEFFTIGLELPEDDPDVLAGEKLRGPNNWPPGRPGFRRAMEGYYEAIGACGADLLGCVAISLGLPQEFFRSRYAKRLQRTQLVYYPPQIVTPETEGQEFGVAPHTDFGCITLLWQDDTGGLEVQERSSGGWIAAPPIPGTLVINVGDLLGRWTNDRYASTPHRVVNRSGRERFSVATFYDPDFQAVVDPVQLGTAAADSRYEPTTAGAHILGRIERSFGYRKTLAEKAA